MLDDLSCGIDRTALERLGNSCQRHRKRLRKNREQRRNGDNRKYAQQGRRCMR